MSADFATFLPVIKAIVLKFKQFLNDSKMMNQIDDELNLIFEKYENTGLYDYLNDICENDFLDEYISLCLNASEYKYDQIADKIVSDTEWSSNKKSVVKAFLIDLANRILTAQVEFQLNKNEKIEIKAIERALSNGLHNLFNGPLNVTSDNVADVVAVFDMLIDNGNFALLWKLLNTFQNKADFQDLFQYYKVICSYYSGLSNFEWELKIYFSIENRLYDNSTLQLLIENNECELLQLYKKYASGTIEKLIDVVLSKNPWGKIVFHTNDEKSIYNFESYLINSIHIYLLNYFSSNLDTVHYCRSVLDSIEKTHYVNRLLIAFVKILIHSDNMPCEIEMCCGPLKRKYEEMYWYCECVNKKYSTDRICDTVPSYLVESYWIKRLIYQIMILDKESAIPVNDILAFCIKHKDEALCNSLLGTFNNDDFIAFIKSNRILLETFSRTYIMYIHCLFENKMYDDLTCELDNYQKYDSQLEYKLLRIATKKRRNQDIDNDIKELSVTISKKDFIAINPVLLVEVSINIKRYELLYAMDWSIVSNDLFVNHIVVSLINEKEIDQNILKDILLPFFRENQDNDFIVFCLGLVYYRLGDFITAEKYLSRSFALRHDYQYAIYYLQAAFTNSNYSFNDAIAFCESTPNYFCQYLAAHYYQHNGEYEKAYQLCINSVLLETANQPAIGILALLTTEIKHKLDCDFVSENTYVILKDVQTKKRINVCIYKRNDIVANCKSVTFGNCWHCFIDDSSIEQLLFLCPNDETTFKDKKCVVEKICDLSKFYFEFSISVLKERGEVKVFSGEVNDLVTSLVKMTNNVGLRTKKNTEYYYEKASMLPIGFLAKSNGKTFIETYCYLQSNREQPLPNNIVALEADKYVLSPEVCIVLSQLGIDPSILKGKAMLSKLAYNRLKSAAVTLRNDELLPNDAGFLSSDGKKTTFIEKNKVSRSNNSAFLTHLISFLDEIEKVEDIPPQNELDLVIDQIGGDIEGATLRVAKKYSIPICEENLFVRNIGSSVFDLKTFGVLQIVLNLSFSCTELIGMLGYLRAKNYCSYINNQVLDYFDIRLKTNENDDKVVKNFFENDGDDIALAKRHHFLLYYCMKNYQKENKIKRILCDVVFEFFKKDYPEKYNEIVNSILAKYKQ